MALFTRQEYNNPVKSSKTRLANPTFIPGTKGGFWRIICRDDSRSATNVHQLIDNGVNTEAAALYSDRVSVSAQWQRSGERDLIALGQVHVRQDGGVREDER